jgi:hypothetical protein
MRFFSGATAVVGKNALPAEWIAGVQKDQQQGRRERGAKHTLFGMLRLQVMRERQPVKGASRRAGWVDEKAVVFHTC